MASIQEYIRGLHPDLLKQILWEYCEAGEEYDPATILLVCDALQKHDPRPQAHLTPFLAQKKMFLELN